MIIVVIVIALAIILYLMLRDTPAKNLKKARHHHRLGEDFHKKGDKENSDLHYEIAQQYRQKALDRGEEK